MKCSVELFGDDRNGRKMIAWGRRIGCVDAGHVFDPERRKIAQTFRPRFHSSCRFDILLPAMLRQSFTDFIFATNTDGNGKAASYVRALDMLGPTLTKHYPKPIIGGSLWHGFSLADIHAFSRSGTRPSSRLRRKVLKTLRQQLVDEKVCVKLHLHYPLHAKLYLAHRPKNASNPIMSIMGSSNLTFSGMMCNGELNAEFGDYHDNQKYDHTVIWYDTNSWLMSA